MKSKNANRVVPVEVHDQIIGCLVEVFVAELKAQSEARAKPKGQGLRRGEPSAMSVEELEGHIQRAGGVRTVARAIGVHDATVWGWRRGKHRMRPKHARLIRALPARPRPKPGRPRNPCVLPPDEVRRLCLTLGSFRAAARALGCSKSTLSRAASGGKNLSARLARELERTASARQTTSD